MTDKIVVFCTCASVDEARRIATALVDSRLAACVNLLPPVHSIYHWKGSVEEGDEVLMIIKSAQPLFARVKDEISRLHSYEVPEIIALPIVEGSAPYLAWMEQALTHG